MELKIKSGLKVFTRPVAHLALLPDRTPAETEQQSELNGNYGYKKMFTSALYV
jgi:hypothetical protein